MPHIPRESIEELLKAYEEEKREQRKQFISDLAKEVAFEMRKDL